MNNLEMVTSKICSAREIIGSVVDSIQQNDYTKAETLANAAYEFLEYYLAEFDDKFKLAWQETVMKQKKEEEDAWDAVNKEKEYYEPSMPPWGHSDLEYLVNNKKEEKELPRYLTYDEAVAAGWEMTDDGIWWPPQKIWGTPQKEDKVVKWKLPVEQVHDDYFVSFPDDLLEAANLKEGDQVEWIDNEDGSYTLMKVEA